MRFISSHITPLVIYNLGVDAHTHAHTKMHTDNPHRNNFKKPGACQLRRMPALVGMHLVNKSMSQWKFSGSEYYKKLNFKQKL